MARPQSCADRLFLAGEMLETASQYIRLCREELGQEDKVLIELSRDQITPLKRRALDIGRDLTELQSLLRKALAASEAGAPPRHRQASSSS
jgi:hypothetical protein